MTAADRQAALSEALRKHHPIMRSETGPFSGCRCGGVRLGENVITHVVAALLPVVEQQRREAAAEALRDAADQLELHGRFDVPVWDLLNDRAAALAATEGEGPR